MNFDAIICDWNGTITRDRDERPLLESIAADVFWASVPCHLMKAIRILGARRTLQRLHQGKRRTPAFDYVTEMFGIYNAQVLQGVPVERVRASVDRYARKKETQEKLDTSILGPVDECHRQGKVTGILSAGYEYGIDSVLAAAGHRHSFDFCRANRLQEEDGRTICLDLTIYRNKREWLLKLLRDLGIEERRVVYIGDSDVDEDCFEIVGYPVVALMATDEAKQLYARRYGAAVPSDEEDLLKYLSAV